MHSPSDFDQGGPANASTFSVSTPAPSTNARLFFALLPDARTSEAFQGLQAPFHGRKTTPANLHLTVVFLGKQSRTDIDRIVDAMSDITVPDLSMQIDRIGYFARQKLVWAGMREVPPALVSLRQQLIAALTATNLPFDASLGFVPHITLARKVEPAPAEKDIPTILWRTDKLFLMESISESAGVRYQPVASRASPGSGNLVSH